jgi:hypothetical protein
MTLSTRSGAALPSNSSGALADLVRPAFLSVPDYDEARTLGPEVAAVATLAGFAPDPEQQLLLDAAFALDPFGKSVAYEVVVVAPRQNLKTGFFKQVALGQLFVRDERLVVWSAHEFDTAQEALKDFESLLEGSEMLQRRVDRVYHGSVPEVKMRNGSRLKFKTRTSGGGRGLSGRKVILDEGYALQAGQIGALMPIMLAQPDPQVFIGSSACRPESAVLWDIVQRGRAGGGPRMVYAEWCAPPPAEACDAGVKCDHARGRPGCGCDKPELLVRTHSAITRGRILVQTLQDLRATMPVEEYGREVMGWHDEPIQLGMPIPDWAACARPGGRPSDPVALGIDVAPLSMSAAIVACGMGAHGKPTLLVAEHRAGAAWVVGVLQALIAEKRPLDIGLDPMGPASVLIPALEQAGIKFRALEGKESTQACEGLLAAVKDGEIEHADDAALNTAAAGASLRTVGDIRKWSRTASTADIAPLVGASIARWLFLAHKTKKFFVY